MASEERIKNLLLSDIIHKVNNLIEDPQPDNNDWLVPDYLSFYKKRIPSFLARLWNRCFIKSSLKKQPLHLEYFNQLLELVAMQRERMGYRGNSIIKMTTTNKTRFIIWGDLHGALHSLVRTLAELKRMLILDDDFRIINDDYWFVFLGDVIDRSPYSAETLMLVLQLMAVNGERVIYLRGNHEDDNTWQEFGLGQELIFKARHLCSEKVPFTRALNRFFNTLPYAFYLKTKNNDGDRFVRMSHLRCVDELFDEAKLSDFICAEDDGFVRQIISEHVNQSHCQVLLDGIICSESSEKIFRFTDGLKLLPSEKGAVVWCPFSSPIKNFQELFGFFNDAFCILDATQNIDQWVISLHMQDVRKPDGFSRKNLHYIVGNEIITAQKESTHVSAGVDFSGEIVVGCTLDLSKTSRIAGWRLKNGIELRINQENALGGVSGKRLKVVFLDDGYTPVLAMKNVATLLEIYKTDMLLSPLGSPVTQSLVPLVKEGKINIFFPYTGLDELRDESLKGICHYRAAYKYEIYALLDYAIGTLKLSRFALIYQDDAYGLGALAGAKEAFNSHGITEWLEAGYSRNTLNMDVPVSKTLEFNPQVIIFIATYSPAATFVEKIGVPFLFNKLFMGVSFLTDSFRLFLAKKGFDFVITRVVPDFTGAKLLPIVQEYLAQQHKYPDREDISWDSLEGYINASFFIEALKNVSEPITKEKVSDYLENMRNVSFNGLQLDFDPAIRGFSKDLMVDTGKELLPWSMNKNKKDKGVE